MVAPALGPPPCRQLAGSPGLSQAGALLRRGAAELSCKQDSLSRLSQVFVALLRCVADLFLVIF